MLKLAVRRRPGWSLYRSRLVVRSSLIMAPKDKKSGGQPRSVHYSSYIRVRAVLLLLWAVLPCPAPTVTDEGCTDICLMQQVLNVDNATAAPSVLLFFDNNRYLFNAGEGIQRHFIEHKQRMKKVWQHSKCTNNGLCGATYLLPCCPVIVVSDCCSTASSSTSCGAQAILSSPSSSGCFAVTSYDFSANQIQH